MAEERLQRRLAAILSADVVGYSRLMGLDEAGTLSRLNPLRRGIIDRRIAAHSGRIVKLMGEMRSLVKKKPSSPGLWLLSRLVSRGIYSLRSVMPEQPFLHFTLVRHISPSLCNIKIRQPQGGAYCYTSRALRCGGHLSALICSFEHAR